MAHVGRLTKASRWAAWKHLQEKGPQTASGIVDYLNNRVIDGHRTKWSITSKSLAQAMRLSPMFRHAGLTYTSVTSTGKSGRSSTAFLWDAVSVEEVRKQVLGKPEALRRLPSYMRNLVESER